MDNRNYNIDPWEQDSYETGFTHPPKSRGGLIPVLLVLVIFLAAESRRAKWMLLSLLIGFGLILYGAHCFGLLLESAKRMSKGNLEEKVDDKLMTGSFQEFAGELNGLADVAVVAAQKQLKSERMKTELITNVIIECLVETCETKVL